ncbi:MAG TPA: hypothetical protein VK939_08750 [Longimicrobiales bacterium]|nr:hypothetical protein [Longimicrobiales bacterium]
MSHNDKPLVVAVTADLIFAARIRASAAAAGAEVHLVRAGEDVAGLVAGRAPQLVLLDLDARWLDVAELIRQLKAEERTARARIVAYGSHVREDAIAAAREAGADRVLARSAFVRLLPELLGG